MSQFNIFTIDLHVILSIIVATGVYALLITLLQKNSPHNVQTDGGGMGSKTALFLHDGFPNVNHEHEITRVIKISKSFLGRTKSTCSKT